MVQLQRRKAIKSQEGFLTPRPTVNGQDHIRTEKHLCTHLHTYYG